MDDEVGSENSTEQSGAAAVLRPVSATDPAKRTGAGTQGPAPFRFSYGDYCAAACVGFAALMVYLLTAAPTVTGEDSGELITAAYTLGIPHPSGYPLWCLLARAVIALTPWGPIAWRVNAVSAMSASATVSLVYLVSVRLLRNRFASACAALSLAFSLEFWQQSIIAEVYTLNAFFVALCVLLVLLWRETRHNRFAYALGLTYGLSLCNHSSMYLLGPVFAVFMAAGDPQRKHRSRTYLKTAAFVCLGFTVQLYLPIRSFANPYIDWGDPQTLRSFWAVITLEQYRPMFAEHPRSLLRSWRQLAAFVRLYNRQFTPAAGWIACVGAAALWRKRRTETAFLGFLLFAVVAGTVLILNFSFDTESLWVVSVCWIPAYLIAAVFLGAAVDWVGSHPARSRFFAVLAIVCGVGLIVNPLLAHYAENDKSGYYFARDYAVNVLKTLDENAIYLPNTDHANFPVQYLQAVEGMRPDVSIGTKYGYPNPALYALMPEHLRRSIDKLPPRERLSAIEEWIVGHTGRPVYFTEPRRFPNLPEVDMAQTGLLFRIVRAGEQLPERDFWGDYVWHTLDPADVRGDYSAALILLDYHIARSRDYFGHSEVESGMDAVAIADRLADDNADLVNDVGCLLAECGMPAEAERRFARALELQPGHAAAQRNLAKVRRS